MIQQDSTLRVSPWFADEELVEWLEEQEVSCETDFLNLSDVAWAAVQRAPGATLVLVDALEQVRQRPKLQKPSEAPSIQRQNSGSLSGGKSAVEMEVHGFIGIITMCNETKRNALSQQLGRRFLFSLGKDASDLQSVSVGPGPRRLAGGFTVFIGTQKLNGDLTLPVLANAPFSTFCRDGFYSTFLRPVGFSSTQDVG